MPTRALLVPGTPTPERRVPAHIARPEYVGKAAPAPNTWPDVQPPEVIEAMRVAGRIAAQALAAGGAAVAPGVTTDEIDRVVHEFLVDAGGEEGGVGVPVHAVDVGGDVDVDDVAVLDHPAVRDPVADHLVGARAQRLREALVAERRGVGVVCDEVLVTDPVQLVVGHARSNGPADLLQRLGGDPAGDAHLRDRLGVLHLRPGERRGRGSVDVFRPRDVPRHGTARRDRSRGYGGHVGRV